MILDWQSLHSVSVCIIWSWMFRFSMWRCCVCYTFCSCNIVWNETLNTRDEHSRILGYVLCWLRDRNVEISIICLVGWMFWIQWRRIQIRFKSSVSNDVLILNEDKDEIAIIGYGHSRANEKCFIPFFRLHSETE